MSPGRNAARSGTRGFGLGGPQLARDHFERPPLRPQRERERERYSIMGLQGRVTDSSTFRYLILSTELGVLFETSRHNNH